MHFLYLFNLFVILSLYCFYNLCLVSCFEVLFENHIFLWKSFLNKDDYYLYLKVLLFLSFTAAHLGLTLINTLHGKWSVSMCCCRAAFSASFAKYIYPFQLVFQLLSFFLYSSCHLCLSLYDLAPTSLYLMAFRWSIRAHRASWLNHGLFFVFL